MRPVTKTLKLLLLILLCTQARSQDTTLLDKIVSFPDRLIDKVNKKTNSLDADLLQKSEKYIQRLLKSEKKLKKKLARFDSAAAKNLFAAGTTERYTAALSKLKNAGPDNLAAFSGEYMPYVDSLKGSLQFLQLNSKLATAANFGQSLDKLQQLQARLQLADQLKQLIQQRKEQIKRFLSKYTQLPNGLKNIYTEYSKQAYYYAQQVKEYRAALNDPDKLFGIALKLLNKIPAFASFMQKNSMLAGLFNMPGQGGAGMNNNVVTGLQSRSQIMSYIQNQAGGDPSSFARLQQSMNSAQQQTDDLRNRLNLRGMNSGELDMPDFKPNNQKTKSFWKRLEYGTNLQTVPGKYYFPVTTDLGLSVGYKLSDKNVIGIGASYKVGWGKDIKHIDITSQGAGIRSYIDINIKKSFFLSGGFEYNYQPLSLTDSLPVPAAIGSDGSSWQQSGLIGITKIISLRTKMLKKTKMQLLWDFLSYRQAPGTPALKFRVGYSF